MLAIATTFAQTKATFVIVKVEGKFFPKEDGFKINSYKYKKRPTKQGAFAFNFYYTLYTRHTRKFF